MPSVQNKIVQVSDYTITLSKKNVDTKNARTSSMGDIVNIDSIVDANNTDVTNQFIQEWTNSSKFIIEPCQLEWSNSQIDTTSENTTNDIYSGSSEWTDHMSNPAETTGLAICKSGILYNGFKTLLNPQASSTRIEFGVLYGLGIPVRTIDNEMYIYFNFDDYDDNQDNQRILIPTGSISQSTLNEDIYLKYNGVYVYDYAQTKLYEITRVGDDLQYSIGTNIETIYNDQSLQSLISPVNTKTDILIELEWIFTDSVHGTQNYDIKKLGIDQSHKIYLKIAYQSDLNK